MGNEMEKIKFAQHFPLFRKRKVFTFLRPITPTIKAFINSVVAVKA
jgi:hypothetical protein